MPAKITATATLPLASPMPGSGSSNLQMDSLNVGEVFSQVVMDVRRSVPVGVTSAIDVHLEFKSLRVSEKGIAMVWVNKSTDESSMSIKLATRIEAEAPVVTNEFLVRCIERSLIEEGILQGPATGEMTQKVDNAITRAITTAPSDSDLRKPPAPAKLKDADVATKRMAYLQHALNKRLAMSIAVDGADGPETRRALFMLFRDRSMIGTP